MASVGAVGIAINKVPTGPYRDAGRPESTFVIERLADMAARSLGVDPAEIRRRNLIRHDTFPCRTALGYTYDSGDYSPSWKFATSLINTSSNVKIRPKRAIALEALCSRRPAFEGAR